MTAVPRGTQCRILDMQVRGRGRGSAPHCSKILFKEKKINKGSMKEIKEIVKITMTSLKI